MTNYDWTCERFLTYLTSKKEGIENTLKAMENVATDESLPMMTWGASLCEEIMQDTIDMFMRMFDWDDGQDGNGHMREDAFKPEPQLQGKLRELESRLNVFMSITDDFKTSVSRDIQGLNKRLTINENLVDDADSRIDVAEEHIDTVIAKVEALEQMDSPELEKIVSLAARFNEYKFLVDDELGRIARELTDLRKER